MYIAKTKILTTLQVYYYMPDYHNLIQEFVWQYNDRHPAFPRTHKFLNFWHKEIDAVIESVNLSFIDYENRTHIKKGILDI
jgi:uncharacterized protein Usg